MSVAVHARGPLSDGSGPSCLCRSPAQPCNRYAFCKRAEYFQRFDRRRRHRARRGGTPLPRAPGSACRLWSHTCIDRRHAPIRSVSPGRRCPAHTGRRVGFFETLSRVFRLTETLGFQPFEFLAHGSFHNRSEVYARHERGEPLDFVTKLGARRELNFITRGGQRLDDRQLLRCFRSRSWRRGLTILSDAVWTGSV